MIRKIFKITGTSPASATTAIIGAAIGGLHAYDWFAVDAIVQGGTGGTLDLYLQRQIAMDAEVTGGVWVDWLRLAQLADGAAAVKYTAQAAADLTIRQVEHSTDASVGTTPQLSVNTFCGGHPGQALRLVGKAGAGTSSGAAQTVYVSCFQRTW